MTYMNFLQTRYKPAALLASFIIAFGILLLVLLPRSATLPYHDSFASGLADEWVPQGGIWEVKGGSVFNRSDERISKLISGSPDWKDYQLDADMKYIGHEEGLGVIVRVGVDDRGYDNYNGYFVGLRSEDSALLIARSDHGWMEGQPSPVTGGVQIGTWYHLHVVVIGCQIGAEVTKIETKQTSWVAFSDRHCFQKGKVGLRSDSTGGAWRNVSVTATSEDAWQAIRSHAAFVTQPDFPGREADYSRMRENYFKDTYDPVLSYRDSQTAAVTGDPRGVEIPPIVNIQSIRTPPMNNEPVTIRGVVTLASPLYVQDSTDSIAVESSNPNELNLGDEVEISGKTGVNGFTPVFDAASIRLLWDRTLVAPVSITSTQAASGAFDASLVELSGILESKTKSPDHVIMLRLYDSAQTFTVIVRSGLSMQSYDRWAPGSTLRIRGICTIPPSPSDTRSAFTILSRSINDVQVLAGPPWWTGWQLIRLLLMTLLLICFGIYFYLRLARWKMNTIVSERERLAHDLHDTLAQSFAGIGYHLQGLSHGMQTGNTSQAEAVAMLQDACDIVALSHREASASIATLHPDADGGQDFLVALDRSTQEMLYSSHNGISLPIEFVREGVPQPLSMPVRDALFHIGREAITNMIRHAKATSMEIKLRYEPRGVILEVRDNGVGFPFGQEPKSFGIRGMQSRCAKIGANMDILSAPAQGTTIIVRASYGRQPKLIDWIRSLRQRIINRW
jgi:two-component sensor histidine kinase